jgi:MFS family permease
MEAAMKSAPAAQNRDTTASRPFIAGIITGQLAGLIMAVVVMIVFALCLGKSPLYPVQVIGSVLQGFHFGALLAGLVLHQAGPSLLWGAIYGLLAKKFPPQTTGAALALGLGIGVVSMTGPYLLIPAVMNAMQGVDLWNREVPMFWDWAAHIVFGASFALYPLVERKLQSHD